MLKYIFKRVLYFIPTLFLISLFTFGLSKMAPGDPVELRLAGGKQGGDSGNQESNKLAGEKQYLSMKKKLGLDIPSFYFDFTSQSVSDTLYKITRENERETLKGLTKQYGNWQNIQEYYDALKNIEKASFSIEKGEASYVGLKSFANNYNKLINTDDDKKINLFISKIEKAINKEVEVEIEADSAQLADPSFVPLKEKMVPLASMSNSLQSLKTAYASIKENATPIKNWIPKFSWHGAKNQYHVWLFGNTSFTSKEDPNVKYGFFRGDFGNSYRDGRPVKSIIWEALGITLKLNIIAILIGIMVSIPLGVALAKRRGTKFDRISSILLFILYSLPNFWVATMFIVYFTTPEYGMDWFPTYGLRSQGMENASFIDRFLDQAHHLVLPIIVMTYGAFTYSARQMRGSMIGVMQQDYIRTAVAKGLSDKVVTWKHTFRNSLIPIITMFASILPSLIGGSMIIEIIFNINGMGRAAFDAVTGRNFPILFTVLMFSAILVMISMLLADLMYAAVDPRISFTKKKG